MRVINKGVAHNTYTEHGQARHDLAKEIGYYCSYCEMGVKNMIEVEHVIPVNQGGNPLNWDNFLLSCRYCNGVKNNNNITRVNYLWVDRDNTDLAFIYSETDVILAQHNNIMIEAMAENTIRLMGLDRIPSGVNEPTEADTRWRSRIDAWSEAKKSLTRWLRIPRIDMAEQIGSTAIGFGHYSIWRTVFENEQMVLDAIDFAYSEKGLFKQYLLNGTREIRQNGTI